MCGELDEAHICDQQHHGIGTMIELLDFSLRIPKEMDL